MDTHRVQATVLEYFGQYRASIEEYQRAADLAPNFTFLYLRIGYGWRNLGNKVDDAELAKPLYENALAYFDRAAKINAQLGILDPQPFIAIAKTYTQMGEFFAAAPNAQKALKFDPTDPNSYGLLGGIYVKAKNYEYAIPTLQCPVEGCTTSWLVPPQDTDFLGAIQCKDVGGCNEDDYSIADYWLGDYVTKTITVAPLELTNLTVAYYYIQYGSVLAYLSRPGDGSCEHTLALMTQLRQSPLSEDLILMSNIEDNEALCARLMKQTSP
jgi:tetratricopeptide (TPR) repeat protein